MYIYASIRIYVSHSTQLPPKKPCKLPSIAPNPSSNSSHLTTTTRNILSFSSARPQKLFINTQPYKTYPPQTASQSHLPIIHFRSPLYT